MLHSIIVLMIKDNSDVYIFIFVDSFWSDINEIREKHGEEGRSGVSFFWAKLFFCVC